MPKYDLKHIAELLESSAYLAGLYESRGSCGSPSRLEIRTRDADPVRCIHDWFDGEYREVPNAKQFPYEWSVSDKLSFMTLTQLMSPWLSSRRTAEIEAIRKELRPNP